jgi:protein SCO1
MRRYLVYLILGVVIGLAIITAVVFARPYSLRGSQIDPPVPAPDFTLTDGLGNGWTLSDQQDKIVLIFFGYTYCPDVCPATLGELKSVRAQLGKPAEDVQVVFITVDPERDTPERIGKYVAAFDPTFVALSGSQADLEPVWKAYGVYRQIQPNASGAGYLVDHTARTYLIDRSGSLRVSYSFGTPLDDFVQDVKFLLKESVQQ